MQPERQFKETYNVHELAAMFNVTEPTVRAWLRGQFGHKLNGTRVGNTWVVSHEEMVRFANLMYGGTP